MTDNTIGAIIWRDLTIDNAEHLSEFYRDVVGWQVQPVSMGDYNDFNMNDDRGETVAGVCHARGANVDMPPQWLMYVRVADLEASIKACTEGGGKVLSGPRALGRDRYCVIEDPAGACLALYAEAQPE